MLIAYIKFGKQTATILASSIEQDPLFSKFVLLKGVTGLKELQYPLFKANTLRIGKDRIEYMLEGTHEDPEPKPITPSDIKKGSISLDTIEANTTK